MFQVTDILLLNNLFDLAIISQGQSNIILILDTCPVFVQCKSFHISTNL